MKRVKIFYVKNSDCDAVQARYALVDLINEWAETYERDIESAHFETVDFVADEYVEVCATVVTGP